MSSDMRMSLIITDDDEKLVKETLPDIYVIPSLFPQKTTILNYKAVLKTPNWNEMYFTENKEEEMIPCHSLH